MLNCDLDNLDLGSRRKPTEWVAFAPVTVSKKKNGRQKQKPPRRNRGGDKKSDTVVDANGEEWASAASQKLRDWCGSPVDTQCDERHLQINSGLYKNESRSSQVEWLPPETEDGNTEYKLRLRSPTAERFEQLVTQMQFRLSEGGGTAYYYVGVEDNGYPRGLEPEALDQSMGAVMAMADRLDAAATVDRVLEAPHGRVAARLCVRRLASDGADYEDLRVVALGASGSGKSTLMSVLCNGQDGRPLLDDGRGRARTAVFRHKHEVETGRTSAVSQHSVGYDDEGGVVNYAGVSAATLAEVSASARKLVSLIDTGGHRKYMKTALRGLTAMLPDYAMVCFSCAPADRAASGERPVPEEVVTHLAAAAGLGVPVFGVLTKADLAPEGLVDAVAEELHQALNPAVATAGNGGGAALFGSRAWVVKTAAQAREAADRLRLQRGNPVSIPLFPVSSVTGAGLPPLHDFLGSLSGFAAAALDREASAAPFPGFDAVPRDGDGAECSVYFQVGDMFDVESVGSVASGTLLRGSVSVGSVVWLGPGDRGRFTPCQVTSIHRFQVPVRSVRAGQAATMALHPTAGAAAPPGGEGEVSGGRDASPGPPGGGDGAGPEGGSPASCCSSLDSFPFLSKKPCAWAGGRTRAAAPPPPPPRRGGWAELLSAEHDGAARSALLQPVAPHPESGRWMQVGLASGSEPLSQAAAPRRGSRGAVLLGPARGCRPPSSVLEFEAEVVLLPGGHWPPRGLVSGRWPPVEHDPSEPELPRASSGGSCSEASSTTAAFRAPPDAGGPGGRSAGRGSGSGGSLGASRYASDAALSTAARGSSSSSCRSQRRIRKVLQRRLRYTHTVLCGSVRQSAAVVGVQELGPAAGRRGGEEGVPPELTAARLSALGAAGDGAEEPCAARVRFRFVHHPEWLAGGSRLLVRDRTTGQLAAAGVVLRVGC